MMLVLTNATASLYKSADRTGEEIWNKELGGNGERKETRRMYSR
jgi:hypothetical protein